MNSTNVCSKLVSALNDLYSFSKMDKGHGIDHSLNVLDHVNRALAVSNQPKDEKIKTAIKAAALLHDADDRKFFSTENYQNARDILERVVPRDKSFCDLVIEMIKLVSYSSNGNSNEVQKDKQWMLFPRYADRLEATGEMGILRCYLYNIYVKRPLFTDSTEYPQNKEDLSEIINIDRYNRYLEGDVRDNSFIGHFYDKILHLAPHIIDSGNPYFIYEARMRHAKVVEFILDFGKTGKIDMHTINMLRWKEYAKGKKK